MQYENNAIITPASPSSWNDATSHDDSTMNDNSNNKKRSSAKKATATAEKSKRKQVKNACVNCQKACKKCDDGRPCKRCVKLGLTATCRDSDRKERKKGVKRGPYKKRQAYIKDKPVYPKLTEEYWKQPIYENVPQVLSNQSIYNDFYDGGYCVPSQQLSPAASSTSFAGDESDETLHYAYGYGYTNSITNSPALPLAINTTVSMLDHNQAISGNVTPISYSWDDNNYMESFSSGSSSPIGSTHMNNDISSSTNVVQFQQPFPTTADIIYQTQQQKELSSIIIQQPAFDFNSSLMNTTTAPNYWYNQTDMPIEYHQPAPVVSQQYFEYSIPSQQQQFASSPSWTTF